MKINLGNIIKEGLYRKRLSQSDLAKKIGKTRQTINAYIQNKNVPELETLRKILVELDCVGDVFPGYRKAESDLEKRIDRLEKLLIEQKLENKISKIENLANEIVEEKKAPLTA